MHCIEGRKGGCSLLLFFICSVITTYEEGGAAFTFEQSSRGLLLVWLESVISLDTQKKCQDFYTVLIYTLRTLSRVSSYKQITNPQKHF